MKNINKKLNDSDTQKYFVVVNQKYIVNVESTSSGGAEHVILDNIKHSKSAMAFSIMEIQTDTFQGWLKDCETISYDELKRKDNHAIAKGMERINSYIQESEWIQERIDNELKEIEELEEKISLIKANIEIFNEQKKTMDAERKEFARKADLDDTFTDIDTIQDLLSA